MRGKFWRNGKEKAKKIGKNVRRKKAGGGMDKQPV